MELLRSEALKAADSERGEAKRLKFEAARKEKMAKQLREKAHKEQAQAKVLRYAGPAGAVVGPFRFYGGSKKEQEARSLEKEAESMMKRARYSEQEARKWEAKARLAEKINAS